MSDFKKIGLLFCLVLSINSFAQQRGRGREESRERGREEEAKIFNKVQKISNQIQRNLNYLAQRDLRRIDEKLEEVLSILKGETVYDDCKGPRCQEQGGGKKPSSQRISATDFLISAVSDMYYLSGKSSVIEAGIDFIDEKDLNHLNRMCGINQYESQKYECLKKGLASFHYKVMLSNHEAKGALKAMCSQAKYDSDKFNCFKSGIDFIDTKELDYILETCQSIYYLSSKVQCLEEGLK